MIERTLMYSPADRELYRAGKLYSRWRKKYKKSTLFLEMLESEATQEQFPVNSSHRLKNIYGFGELFAGIHYLDRGFKDVNRYYYYCHAGYDSYEKAVGILGPQAAKFICRPHPQPPDLFVVDRKDRFFFVEVKLPSDRLNQKQIDFNRNIERYLNKNMPQRRAPHMPKGHWIELLRLRPEPD
jgi:hypothetical protein